MQIREAKIEDLDFLVDTIIEAEKSETETISYCRIFNLQEEKLRELLKEMLLEEVYGQEICLQSFLVAEENGECAAAIAAWIEEEEEIPSHILKANLLSFFIPHENLVFAQQYSALLQKIHISREKGSMQLESLFVHPKYRGKALARKLIEAQIVRFKDKKPNKMQLIVAFNNEIAIKNYEKLGMYKKTEKKVNDPKILDILPAKANALFEKELRY
jgi:ribosomal protein S18 acetylase RimI-like enzyme